MVLPGWDGCAVLEAIRADPQITGLPVIMLTSSEADEDIARCYDASATAYLTKPTAPDEFVSLIEAVEPFWLERVESPRSRRRFSPHSLEKTHSHLTSSRRLTTDVSLSVRAAVTAFASGS